MTNIKNLIGDYQEFFSDQYSRLEKMGISIEGLAIVQLLYRVEKLHEYENLKHQLKLFSDEFVETQFNGRAVAVFVLKESLGLGNGFSTDIIELPAPRPVHMYPTGLESVGFLVGKDLPKFNKKYQASLTGIKDHGEYVQPSFITFDNSKTVKFYDKSLLEIVKLQGWKFEKLG